jgi:hypothetical protein
MRAVLRTASLKAIEWAGWALVLNLIWEVAQLPFYAFAPALRTSELVWNVVHCTAGDVGIALASFGVAALGTREPDWPGHRPWGGLAAALVAGLAWTAYSEWQNVYVRGTWAYAEAMPTVFGIGLLPVLQWLVLPPLALLALRYRLRVRGDGPP